MTKHAYIFGKLLGNTLYLMMLTAIMAVMALVTFGMRGEGPLEVISIVWPYFLLPVPATFTVAGIAVLGEALGWRRGFRITAVYITLWLALVTIPTLSMVAGQPTLLDLNGVAEVASRVTDAVGSDQGVQIGIIPIDLGAPTFYWPGLDFSHELAAKRALWILLGLFLGVLASITFDRFDPSRRNRSSFRKAKSVTPAPGSNGEVSRTAFSISALSSSEVDVGIRRCFMPLALLRAELSLALRGRQWYLYACLVVLALSISLSTDNVHSKLAVVSVVLALPVIADLSIKERQHGITDLIFASPSGRSAFVWRKVTVALLLACMVIVGPVVRLLFTQPTAALWLLSGIIFSATWAVAAGILSGDERLFLVSSLLLWYLSGANDVPAILDYAGFNLSGYYDPDMWIRLIYPVFGCLGLLLAFFKVQSRRPS